MARLPRFYLPGQPLHVIQRGNNRDPIFAADADYHFICDAFRKQLKCIRSPFTLMANVRPLGGKCDTFGT